MNINWNLLLIFFVSGATAVAGNLLLKSGMNSIGGFEIDGKTLIPTLLKFAANWRIIVGFFFYGMSSFLYLKLLTSGEVTKIYPLVVSYMFILLLIFGGIFLKESITITKVLGIAIIILGIFTASR